MVIQGPWKRPSLKELLDKETQKLMRLLEEYRAEQQKGTPAK